MPQQPPSVQGPIDKVPCPACGKANDFRILESQQLLDTGHEVSCDACGYLMIVTAIRKLTLVAVMRDPKGRREPAYAKRAAQVQQQKKLQQKPGFFGKLLGGGGKR